VLTRKTSPLDRKQTERLHPAVYKITAGIAAWTGLAIWGFFGHGGYIGVVLVVVTGFILVAVGIPFILWRIGKRYEARQPDARDDEESLLDWARRDLGVWQARMKGMDAMVGMLLPLAAVAIGMTVFVIVWRLVLDGAI
jgi:hypothetical protein